MGTITALSPQKKNPERLNVYLDGRFAFGLAQAAATHLRIGQTLDEDEQAALLERDTVEKGLDLIRNYVSYRPRSAREIARHLRRKQYEPAVVEEILERLSDTSLVDDEAFAHFWVEQRESFRPRSLLALRQELSEKGVDRTTVDQALAEIDELATARRAVAPKARLWQSLPPEAFRKKVSQFLARRGFPYGIVKEVVAELETAEALGDE